VSNSAGFGAIQAGYTGLFTSYVGAINLRNFLRPGFNRIAITTVNNKCQSKLVGRLSYLPFRRPTAPPTRKLCLSKPADAAQLPGNATTAQTNSPFVLGFRSSTLRDWSAARGLAQPLRPRGRLPRRRPPAPTPM